MNRGEKLLLITGAAGHSGQLFLKKLADSGQTNVVRVVLRQAKQSEVLKAIYPNLDVMVGDIADEQTMTLAMRGVNTVLHIAGIGYSPNIVKLGSKLGVSWFILVHTTGRFSKYKSLSKDYIRIEDELINNYDNLTILRPTMIYGSMKDRNISKLIRFIAKFSFFPIFGQGKNLMQPVNGEDLACAYLAVLNNQLATINRQYNLSGRDAISYAELISTIASGLGKNIKFIKIPIWLSYILVGLFYGLSLGRFPLSPEQVLRMKEDKVYGHQTAVDDFGYRPMSFTQGITEEISEYIDTNAK